MSDFVYDIRLNHVGIPRKAKKTFVYMGTPENATYEVKRLSAGNLKTVYSGTMSHGVESDTVSKDVMLIGDFSAVTEEGVYKIFVGNKHSRTFYIYDKVYDSVCRTITQYFEWQRCGDECGYNPYCHLGDKLLDKEGNVHALVGGHHQSGDLRKWAFGCPAGIFGLSEYLINHSPIWNKGRLEYDVRHSAKHYLSRISPDGYVFDSTFVPDYYEKIWHGVGYPTEKAFWDDFLYFDEPTDPHGHCNVIRMLSSASRSLKATDPEYAEKCLAGAKKIAEWMYKTGQYRTSHEWKIYPPLGHDTFKKLYFDFYFENSAHMLADLAFAEIELFRATCEEIYKARALKRLKALSSLQLRHTDGTHDKFLICKGSLVYAEEVKYFPISFPLVFAKAYDIFGDSPEAESLLDMLRSFVKFYKKQTKTNSFGKTTTKIKANEEGHTWDYKASSYVQDLADTALFLTIASRYIDKDECLGIAQRLLDFIVGANHVDASCIEAVGYNQFPYAVFGEFFPPIPKIPGAVITEIWHDDPQEDMYGREYDMPIVGATLLAFAEYQKEVSK